MVTTINTQWQKTYDSDADARKVISVDSDGSGVTKSMLIDAASDTVTYIGEAPPGTGTGEALWRVKKITVVSTITSFEYADSNTNYDNKWDDRASLSYG